jgi:multiple sugar transport system substrate-binding protein
MKLLVTICLLLVLLTPACGGDEGNGDGPVRFLVFGDPEEIRAFRDVTRAYRRESGRAVQLVEASDRSDLIARLSTSISGGEPPDIFLINYRYYGQFAAREAIEPVSERLESSEAFEADDFFSEPLEAFRWRGEQLCIPQNVSSLAVYVNRNLFRKYSVDVPSRGWTWSQFIETASALTRDARGRVIAAGDPELGGKPAAVYGLGVEPSIIRVAPFVWSNGGELVDDQERPTRLAFGGPGTPARDALAQFFSLRTPFGFAPSDQEVEAEDDESRFANGRLAMLISSRRSVPTFRTITAFEWDVVPFPVLHEAANVLHSDAYCIAKLSNRRDDAWRFVEFALGPEGQRILARSGRTVPSLRAVAESDAFLDKSKPPRNARVFLDAVPHLRPLPQISTWPEIEDATAGILENGFYLGTPVDQVVRELDEATRPLFARGETAVAG